MSMLRFNIRLWLILLLIIATNSLSYAEQDKYHFRHSRWGMTKEEVRISENGPQVPELSKEDVLAFKSQIFGDEVIVIYKFSFNKLIWGKYLFTRYMFDIPKFNPDKKLNVIPGLCIVDFFRYEELLIKKYGKPEKQIRFGERRVQDLIKSGDDRMNEAMNDAIRSKKAAFATSWRTKETLINLMLHGGDAGQIVFEIGYSSIKLIDSEKEDIL